MSARRNRLRWRCRRGMRELDMLLEPWVAQHAGGLDDAELSSFERFLDSSDMDLYAWFTGRGLPDDGVLAAWVERILADSRASR